VKCFGELPLFCACFWTESEATFTLQRLHCSDSRRWALPGVLTLNIAKRPLGMATGAGLYGACVRYSSRRASATW
jgi:hypothetical protein